MHSSQNEQDNRYYARFAKIPMLEPATARSRRFVNSVSRSANGSTSRFASFHYSNQHGKSIITLEDESFQTGRSYSTESQKYVMIPAYARMRHKFVEDAINDSSNTARLRPESH